MYVSARQYAGLRLSARARCDWRRGLRPMFIMRAWWVREWVGSKGNGDDTWMRMSVGCVRCALLTPC
jgi:hypothetical protein